jgi:hypothetical protein
MNSTVSKKTAVVGVFVRSAQKIQASCEERYASQMTCIRDESARKAHRDCVRVYFSYDLCKYLQAKGEAVR